MLFHILTATQRVSVRYWYRRGCLATAIGPRSGLGRITLVTPEVLERLMKRKVPGAQLAVSGVRHLAAVESNILHLTPSIISHCCVTMYDDGEQRRPGWVTLSTMGSSWRVVAKDPDAAVSLTAIGQSLDDALTLMELLLSSEEAPWEPDQFLSKGKKK